MQLVCSQTADFFESLDPFATAGIGVSWAGEMTALVWFENARELTERWHHQEQIRLATNRPSIMIREMYHPVLDTFMRGLPHTYRDVEAAVGTGILIEISGDSGGQWCLVRSEDGWRFTDELPSRVAARVVVPQSIAWRLFTKGIDREAARSVMKFDGDIALGERVLQLIAIVG
jgi:hypothetical protein